MNFTKETLEPDCNMVLSVIDRTLEWHRVALRDDGAVKTSHALLVDTVKGCLKEVTEAREKTNPMLLEATWKKLAKIYQTIPASPVALVCPAAGSGGASGDPVTNPRSISISDRRDKREGSSREPEAEVVAAPSEPTSTEPVPQPCRAASNPDPDAGGMHMHASGKHPQRSRTIISHDTPCPYKCALRQEQTLRTSLHRAWVAQSGVIEDLRGKYAYAKGSNTELRLMIEDLKKRLAASEKEKRVLSTARDIFYQDLQKTSDLFHQRSDELVAVRRERDLAQLRWENLRAAIRSIPRFSAVVPVAATDVPPSINPEGQGEATDVDAEVETRGQPRPIYRLKKGQVVMVQRTKAAPSGVRFASVSDDITIADGVTSVPVRYLQEVGWPDIDHAQKGAPPQHLERWQSVRFLTHLSKRPGQVLLKNLLMDADRVEVLEWQDGDIWDQLDDGSFRPVLPDDYTARGEPISGVRATLFLLDEGLYDVYLELGNRGADNQHKRKFTADHTSRSKRTRTGKL